MTNDFKPYQKGSAFNISKDEYAVKKKAEKEYFKGQDVEWSAPVRCT